MIEKWVSIPSFIYLSILFAGLTFLYFIFYALRANLFRSSDQKNNLNSKLKSPQSIPLQKKRADNQPNIMEVFDYRGIKILHENGVYTVNKQGNVSVFPSWEQLPAVYKAMVKDLDNRTYNPTSADKGKSGYFLEIINGKYFVTTPNGKKKKYSSLSSIPQEIRSKIGR